MRIKNLFHLFILLAGFIQCSNPDVIQLEGKWYYKLDEKNIGIKEKWNNHKFEDKLELPGSLRDNGIGNIPSLETKWTGSIYDSSWFFNPEMKEYRKPGNLKFPFWLTPETRYVGAAWYQKEIDIPAKWEGKEIELFLERTHWQTSVWIDTLYMGSQNSLSTPHIFKLQANKIEAGRHTLTIRVDNAINDIDPGINSHSISDHTQGNWNGIIGDIQLKAKSSSYISLVRLTPLINSKSIKAQVFINNLPDDKHIYKMTAQISGLNHKQIIPEFSTNINSNEIVLEIPMGNEFKTWSEFSPMLYKITLFIENESGIVNSKTETFGMRNFTVNCTKFKINGIPIFLRGTTECSVFPLTGYPPTNEEDWTRIFKICKDFGLNHMRFHSYCPPEAAFMAADKTGIYLQVEGPSWAKYSTVLGNGHPIDKYLMDETKRIIDAYGNHPSFCMMAYGNEPSGNYVGYLETWVDSFRNYDPQRVFTGASTGRSWAIIDNSDFIVRSPPRGLKWDSEQPESEFDYRDNTENQNRPYVSFEMGQWCVFPNFKEIIKYTGPLKARNFELFREELNKHHMGKQAQDFLMASGKLQAACYKQEIEATLRTPNLAGFQLLSLNDFTGQGTALVGVLDAFWDEKGYITAKEFSSFCNSIVPLVRLSQFTFENTDTLVAKTEIANFSGQELEAIPKWELINRNGVIVKSGSFNKQNIPIGNCISLGEINILLNFIKKAEKLTLRVIVNEYSNQWNIWVYLKSVNIKNTYGIYICDTLDNKTLEELENGGKVLLLASGRIQNGKEVKQYFTPVFWNTSWYRMRPPHTTGILIDTNSKALKNFPTDYYSDMQWWDLVNRQQVMKLKNFPPEFKPIVQPIDTWFLNRRLAMLFETNTLNGKIMVCSIDLSSNIENRLTARQLRKSIVDYMQSNDFNPDSKINIDIIKELFEKKERESWNSCVKENP